MSCGRRGWLAIRQLGTVRRSAPVRYVHTPVSAAVDRRTLPDDETISGGMVASGSRDWRLLVGVLVERLPLVCPSLTPTEQRFQRVMLAVDDHNSLLNDFEIKRQLEQQKMDERTLSGSEGRESFDMLTDTTFEREDLWKSKSQDILQSLQSLRSAELVDDTDQTLLKRRSDRKLALIVRQRFSIPDYVSPWMLPQTYYREGDTLRQTADRCLVELGLAKTATVLGNAPVACRTRKLPARTQAHVGVPAVKTFFYRAVIKTTRYKQNVVGEDLVDYKWVTHEELNEHLRPTKPYRSLINRLLFE